MSKTEYVYVRTFHKGKTFLKRKFEMFCKEICQFVKALFVPIENEFYTSQNKYSTNEIMN